LIVAVAIGEETRLWTQAHEQGSPTAAETRAIMKSWAECVYGNHLKTKDSPQKGMVYEYFDVRRKGQFDQFVQGEALDTMHDGAWLAAAMVHAYRVTDDDYYRRMLLEHQLPFYLKMLNHSDELFSPERNNARTDAPKFNREHLLQAGEKGFVPYWWDDGSSVSLERRQKKDLRPDFPATDFLAGKPNPNFLLSGYSHGSSNHLAQDLGVMLVAVWSLTKEEAGDGKQGSAERLKEVEEACRNLYECRMRHHGPIPMCVAPLALATGDEKLMQRVTDPSDKRLWTPGNHYTRAFYDFEPGKRYSAPGFMDDAEYHYYSAVARAGGEILRPIAFKLIYDALTEPLFYGHYCDDQSAPPGMNRFDLYPLYAKDGKPEHFRSEKKGPFNRPIPTGSRMGPQSMVVAGWALQLLDEHPGIWDERYTKQFGDDVRVDLHDPTPWEKKREPKYSPVVLGDLKLEVAATRTALLVRTRRIVDVPPLRIHRFADAKGSYADLALGHPAATNDDGDYVQIMVQEGDDDELSISIPFACTKGQLPWATAIEHSRISLKYGDAVKNLYVASREEDVRSRLKWELAGGLRTWQAVFESKGYIPTGLGRGEPWDHFSDSGGYAHLIKAASQYLLWSEGKRDWEELR
jgi:hypothetical protein